MNELLTDSFEEKHNQLKGVIKRCACCYINGCRENVDDVVQEILVRVWENWRELKVLPADKLNNYVFIVTRNHIFNIARHNKRVCKYQEQYKHNCAHYCWHDEILVDEGFKVYKQAIEQLSPAQREVFSFYENGVDRFEIAEALQKSKNTIKNQLNGAFKTVRNYLNKNWYLNVPEDGRKRIFRLANLN